MKCDEIEVFLSGYIDRELTQQQSQKVEIHLRDCSSCRALLEQLKAAQEATRQIQLTQPTSEEWISIERRILEQGAQGLGWLILIVWTIVTVGYAGFEFATSPSEPLVEKILIFGLFLGLGLIFLSVLFQRMRECRTDRYRGVMK